MEHNCQYKGAYMGYRIKNIGNDDEAKSILAEVKSVEDATIKYGWDGEWFVRAYDAFENKIGSHECEDGQIFVEPQGFCTMARIGEDLGVSFDAYLFNSSTNITIFDGGFTPDLPSYSPSFRL